MACSCDLKCKTKAEMRRAHGTPKMFGFKVIAAVPEFISCEEAEAAILKYEQEYEAAPEEAPS